MAKSLITDHDIVLNEYSSLIKSRDKYGLRKNRRDEHYSFFPIGTVLMAVPFVKAYEAFPNLSRSLVPGISNLTTKLGRFPSAEEAYEPLERAIASFYVALTTLLLFILLEKISDTYIALLFSLLFGFCSPAWSIASRGLWQHGPLMLLTTIGFLFLVSQKQKVRELSALPLAFSYIVRPTGVIAAGLTALFCSNRFKKIPVLYLSLVIAVMIPFIAFNMSFFGRALPPYYNNSRLTFGPSMPDALFANLLSPSRGLFVFCAYLIAPLFLFFVRRDLWRKAPPYIWLALLISWTHWIAVSAFPNWWGGHTFGPRYMTELVPLLIIVCCWVIKNIKNRTPLIYITLVLGFVNLLNHWQGANNQYVFNWNISPRNVDLYPDRVWEVKGSQFLESLKFAKREIVKRHYYDEDRSFE